MADPVGEGEMLNAIKTKPITETKMRDEIKAILEKCDLTQLTSKKVRKSLEEKFQTDLVSRKLDIDRMLMDLIKEKEQNKDANGESSSRNGTNPQQMKREDFDESSDDSSSDAGIGVDQSPVRKKQRTGTKAKKTPRTLDEDESSDDDLTNQTDADMARKLQEEENGSRRRSLKRGRERSVEKSVKQRPKKNTGGNKRGSLYSKECVLSEELAAVMGTDRMPRHDVVSKMWQIFKQRNMMDPKDKRYIVCDEQLLKVFKVKRFLGFGMMKRLKNHIKDLSLVNDTGEEIY